MNATAGRSGGPLRVGLVGFGLAGSVFHAPLIDATDGLDLSVIVTSDPGRREAAAAAYPGATLAGSVGEMLEPSRRPDLVVVAVPNGRHHEVALAAMEAGLAVVVDKPVDVTTAAARELADAAARLGVPLVPFHNRRWDGDFLTVRDLVGSGRLGEVWRLESRFERWRPGPGRPGSWKQDPALAGGGVLWDLGSHLVDQALVLFGRPSRVYAEVRSRGSGLDDDVFVALDYGGGRSVHLWAGSRSAQAGPRWRVLGSEAGYVKWGMDPQEEALRAGWRPDRLPPRSGPWGSEPESAWGRVGAGEGTEPLETRPGSYGSFYGEVVAHLRGAGPTPVDVADAVAGLEVIEAAVASSTTAAVVDLDR